jgi:hypothetical protein
MVGHTHVCNGQLNVGVVTLTDPKVSSIFVDAVQLGTLTTQQGLAASPALWIYVG